MRLKLLSVFILSRFLQCPAQDTFSILAFDSITREVGAAGASCIDLFLYPLGPNDFITELFPDTGAIATQAYHLPQNQANARKRMRAGDSPTQLLIWMATNDAAAVPSSNSTHRQYGVVRMMADDEQAAGYTGMNCMNYKNHIVGRNYTIHGNILLGKKVLDSMEARFLREKGDLACKLMAAMQGARMVGADTRCASNNSSSLFAFLKVTQPTDTFGKPSLLISLKTHTNAAIEPIDSLQAMFNGIKNCTPNTAGLISHHPATSIIYPNPASEFVTIKPVPGSPLFTCHVWNILGLKIMELTIHGETRIAVKNWGRGIYFIGIGPGTGTWKKVVVE